MMSDSKGKGRTKEIQMRDFLTQIQTALDSDLYYLALFACLSVPDICGAIGSDNGRAAPRKYKEWFDKYVGHKCPFVTGEDCYRFRCSLLHQGSSQHPESRYSRVLFVEPSVTTLVLHCNILNDALNLDVRIFCRDILSGTEDWLQQCEGTELYKKNYGKFMRR